MINVTGFVSLSIRLSLRSIHMQLITLWYLVSDIWYLSIFIFTSTCICTFVINLQLVFAHQWMWLQFGFTMITQSPILWNLLLISYAKHLCLMSNSNLSALVSQYRKQYDEQHGKIWWKYVQSSNPIVCVCTVRLKKRKLHLICVTSSHILIIHSFPFFKFPRGSNFA